LNNNPLLRLKSSGMMAEDLMVTAAILFLVTMVHGRQLTFQVDVNAPVGSVGLDGQRSFTNSDGATSIPKSSPRWIKCRSLMWIKECEEGSVVIATLKRTSREVCETTCRRNPMCKTFAFDASSSNCALTSATSGTTKSNGISGPELQLQAPVQSWTYSRPKPHAEGTEDCSEFHFSDCDEMNINNFNQEVLGTKWSPVKSIKKCKRNCDEGEGVTGGCGAFLFSKNDQINSQLPGFGYCGLHISNVDDLIYSGCDSVTGRVDRDSLEAFDSCMFRGNRVATEKTKCRRGDCNLNHYREIYRESFEDELSCKQGCQAYTKYSPTEHRVQLCTHYKYYDVNIKDTTTHPRAQECIFYEVTKERGNCVSNYKCTNHVLKRAMPDNEVNKCLKDVAPSCGGHGGATQSTPTPPTTPPPQTPPDCNNGMMDIAFLYDDSGSMSGEPQKAVKEWMKKLIDIYNIDGRNRRAAIMQWDSEVQTTITFDENLERDELKDRIDGIRHTGGQTNGVNALKTAFRKLFHRKGDPRVWQAVIFLSDGGNGDGSLGKAAKKFHRKEIRITPVYLGEDNRHVRDMKKMLGKNLKYKNKFFQAKDLTKLTNDQFVRAVSGCPVGL